MLNNVIMFYNWRLSKKVNDLGAIIYRKWINSLPIIVSTIYIHVCFNTSYLSYNNCKPLYCKSVIFFIERYSAFFANMRKSEKWQVKCYGLSKDVFHITIIICIILFFFFHCIMQSCRCMDKRIMHGLIQKRLNILYTYVHMCKRP